MLGGRIRVDGNKFGTETSGHLSVHGVTRVSQRHRQLEVCLVSQSHRITECQQPREETAQMFLTSFHVSYTHCILTFSWEILRA